MKAIAIATVHGKCLVPMLASITEYVPRDVAVFLSGSKIILPRHRTITSDNTATNFGDAFNAVVGQAFQEFDEVVVCNDDIVFTPSTWETLSEDVSLLKGENIPLGWIACRSDYARGYQNIRLGQGRMEWFQYETEHKILTAEVIAPICAWISKEAWIDFPPINWYSDDIQCLDMSNKGLRHFISRAYVHHAGSQTCGRDAMKCVRDAQPWIKENRPELYDIWFKTS